AEVLIKLGRHMEALPIINQIRERAAASMEKLRLPDGTFPTEYRIAPYVDGLNIDWTPENAWEALVWENRLEMAMEGRRYFDLVRWGIIGDVINAYYEKERQRFPWMETAFFTK